MAKDKKSGGFFSAFRRSHPSSNEAPGLAQPAPASAPVQRPNVSEDVRPPSVNTTSTTASVPAKSLSGPTAKVDSPIDTVDAFKVLCQSLTEITASQLKVAEMMMKVIASSLNKISEGVQPKK